MLPIRHQLWLLPVIFVLAVYGVRYLVPAPEAVALVTERRADWLCG